MSEQTKDPNEMVVADLYEVPRMHGKLMPSAKILRRGGNIVRRSYVDFINENTEDNQRTMVIDEKATKKNQEARTAKLNARKESIALKRAVDANIIGRALGNIIEKPKQVEVPKETETQKPIEKKS